MQLPLKVLEEGLIASGPMFMTIINYINKFYNDTGLIT